MKFIRETTGYVVQDNGVTLGKIIRHQLSQHLEWEIEGDPVRRRFTTREGAANTLLYGLERDEYIKLLGGYLE